MLSHPDRVRRNYQDNPYDLLREDAADGLTLAVAIASVLGVLVAYYVMR